MIIFIYFFFGYIKFLSLDKVEQKYTIYIHIFFNINISQ